MDLLKLAAKIELDDSSYVKGVNKAEKLGESLKGKMSAWTVAMGNLAADMVRKGVAAISNVVNGAIDGYADYQQLIGGVETLFKGSADKVANYAKKSFKTTGLSANDYMETVTSFSAALIQGLGGDTEQAADIANMAITDMADNANKMGTDITAIQTAYQGFAKQNYTMLDNLKLGYGGTREEMIRLINDSGILENEISSLDGITFDQLVQAIHAIQTQLDITGTTAKEAASTISGSKASLSAAWEDLLSAVGGEGGQDRLDQAMENFKTSFTTYMENFIPTLATTITNSGSLVEAVADSIAALPTNILADLGERGVESGTQMIGSVSKITSWLIDSLGNVFKSASADPSKVAEFGKAIGDFIGTAISDIVTNAPAIVQGIFDAGIALAGGLVEGLFAGLFGEGAEVDKITDQLQKDITEVDVNSAKASALVTYIQGLVDKYGEAATETQEFKAAMSELETAMPGAGAVFQEYAGDIQGAVSALDAMIQKMKEAAILAGMTKALNAQYELLGEQQTRKAQADVAAEVFSAEAEGMMSAMRESLVAYAQEWLDNAGEDANRSARQKAENIINNGQIYSGGEMVNIEDAGPELLNEMLTYFGGSLENSGLEVWAKDLFDNILPPEEMSSFTARIAELEAGIADAHETSAATQKEIDATQQQISMTEKAVNAAMEQSFTSAAGQVDSGGAAVAGALSGTAAAISSIQFPAYIGGEGVPKAVGIDYVPRNGILAELHEGEAVLTKRQNENRRKASGMDATAFEDALMAAFEKVGIYMGPEKVADITTKRTRANINNESRSRQRAYGG